MECNVRNDDNSSEFSAGTQLVDQFYLLFSYGCENLSLN
jgi:hypothetical protein